MCNTVADFMFFIFFHLGKPNYNYDYNFQLELVLIVEKLQELRSLRIQKLKKQGVHFHPIRDLEYLYMLWLVLSFFSRSCKHLMLCIASHKRTFYVV